MKYFTLALAIMLCSLLSACSDTPSARNIESMLEQQLNSQYSELFDIEQLEKLNGWQDDEQHYTAEVSYTLKFNKSFSAYMNEQTDKPGNALEKVTAGIAAGMLKLQYGDFKEGETYQVKSQKLSFRMTEKGWALSDN